MDEWRMNMGEAHVSSAAYQADHDGVSFMLSHVAAVASVFPTRSGLMGGTLLTIKGTGFSNDKALVQVLVGGEMCHVTIATLSLVECVIAPRGSAKNGCSYRGVVRNGSNYLQGELQPGSRGVRRRIWYGIGSSMSITNLREGDLFNTPDVDEIEMAKIESKVNVQYARGDSEGPHMQYVGFFRAPVSGNFSFLLAADDYASVWVGPNSDTLEQLIDFRSWLPSRSWDVGLWSIGRYRNPIDKVNLMKMQRASRKVAMEEGEYLYIDAHYRSGGGGDNFALGVIQHNSTVNRKDVPAALDEKQFIDIAVPQTLHEVQKVTLTGSNLTGTFRLLLGGKSSRELAPGAAAGDVAAAVRELLSNCEGDIGLATDSSGNTFECFSERGFAYRGLAHATEEGDDCIPWSDTAYFDPWLVVVAGLDGNLCRNPDFRLSGPWCVNSQQQNRSCALARCGGGEEHVKNAPALAIFEDEETNTEDLPFTNSAEERDGVTPKIVRGKGNSFCGQGGLYMNNAWGMIKNEWQRDHGKDPAYEGATPGYPFGTKSFPYICMAYRIPATTKLNFMIRLEKRDEEGVLRGDHVWKTIYLTNDQHHSNHWKVGTWNVIANDEWHYDCLDLQYMLDFASDEDEDLFFGQDHLVLDIIFHTNGVPYSSYADNEFYLDEFAISKTARVVKQTKYPYMPMRNTDSPIRLVKVTKETSAAESSWLIHLTSDDCSEPKAFFDLDVTAIVGVLGANVIKVQDHSEKINGNVVVQLGDKSIVFNPYSNAGQVKTAFEDLSTAGERVNVMRTGTCQTGYGWLVTQTHRTGDLPLMRAKFSEENVASLHVYPYVDGGTLLGPISVDYMHEAVNDNNVIVIVNKGAADCARGACLFSYDDALTPTATEVQSHRTGIGQYSVIITGTGFEAAAEMPSAAVRVTVASLYDCAVSSASDTSVICQINLPFVAAGVYAVALIVPGKGTARGNLTFEYQLEIASITPSNLNRGLVNTVTISGAGFHPTVRSNSLTIGGTACEPILVSASELQCTLGPESAGSGRRRHLLSMLDVQLSSTSSDGKTAPSASSSAVYSVPGNVPTISSTTPSSGAVGGGYIVSIVGSRFSNVSSENTVLLGSSLCKVIEANASSLQCIAGAGTIGSGVVTVLVDGVGVSDAASSPQFEYQLSLTSLTPTPTVFGFGGGNHITVSGQGFVSGVGSDEYVTPILAIAGLQTFVVGVYMPSYTPEKHEIVLTADYENEVQEVSFPNATFFVLAFVGRQTERLPRNVQQHVLQEALIKLMPASSISVFVIATPQGGWQVEFPSELGNVALLLGSTCANLVDPCFAEGINVTEVRAGASPRGAFGLLLGRQMTQWQEGEGSTLVNKSEVSWKARLNVSIADNMQQELSMHAYFGTVRVEKRRPNSREIVWEITYLDLTGARDVPDVDDSLVIGGNVTTRRLQHGIPLPSGTFQMGVGGQVTEEVALNGTAAQVEQAITSAFSDVLSASVFALDNHPGNLLDRSYSRQWVVKLERQGVVGATKDRCTSPLYIDWDPLACPSVAADLFLHHYPWYWPVSLPRPADLGQDAIKARLQQACDAEARANQLRPDSCQALVPLESLPMCGEGSGIHAPCWQTRFSLAKVRHTDGQDIVYERHDSMSPSDTAKGHRSWRRTDLLELQLSQLLSVNHSVPYPSGVDVTAVYVRAEQIVACSSSQVSATALTAIIAPLKSYATSVLDVVTSDYMLKPRRHLSFTRGDPLLALDGLTFESGLTLNGDVMHLNTSVALPFSSDENTEQFTTAVWLKVHASTSSTVPLLQNIGADSFSGYALVLSSTLRWQFFLAAGSQSQNETSDMTMHGFSMVSGAAQPKGLWSHVAITFDGFVQRIYIDGQLHTAAHTPGRYRRNLGKDLVLGGSCGKFLGSVCSEGGTGQFALDELLMYDSALPSAALAAHAKLLTLTINAQLKVKFRNTVGQCSTSCGLEVSLSSTARVFQVLPARGWDGANITILGEGFTKRAIMAVRLGSGSCDSIYVHSDSRISCTARLTRGGVGVNIGGVSVGPVEVLLKHLGYSLSAASFEWIAVLRSISPTAGSLLGGTRVTINGVGLVNNVRDLSVTIGGHLCTVQSASEMGIECLLSEVSWPSSTETRMLPVVLTVEGKEAICGIESGCYFLLSLAATPSITGMRTTASCDGTACLGLATPPRVTQGSILIINGVQLPEAIAVVLGKVQCSVMASNLTTVVCTVRQGHGGEHRLRVRFAQGYGADFSAYCCFRILYDVAVTRVLPSSTGSCWGGQLVTITGSGFAGQRSDTRSDTDVAGTRVFVGQRRARLHSTRHDSIVFYTPSVTDPPRIGVERVIFAAIRHCGTVQQGGSECTGQQLQVCAAALSWGTLAAVNPALPYLAPNSRVLAVPASDGRSRDTSLIDADPSTVWLAQPGSDTLKLVFDFGAAVNVSHLLIYWANILTAAEFRASTSHSDPADCASFNESSSQDGYTLLKERVPWTATTSAASKDPDRFESIELGSIPEAVRILMLELRGLRKDMPSFGIRDLVFVNELQLPFPSRQPVLVEVGGVEASCGAQNIFCSFNYSSAPQVVKVNPSTGTNGTLITINVTGLAVTNCESVNVSISNVECTVTSCGSVDGGDAWIVCAVGQMSGGTYAVEVTISDVPAASNGCVFTYPILITSMTPGVGGYGGAYTVTVNGNGFSNPHGLDALLCGFPCMVTKADMTSLECVTEALSDSAASPGQLSLDVAISNGQDDATEDTSSDAIVLSSGVLSGYLQPWGYEWSWRVVYLRFSAVDIAQGMRVAQARLQVHAADSSCSKGSHIRVWAEASDNSEPFDAAVRGSLGRRARTEKYQDWIIDEQWHWFAEAQESSDLSHIVNDVIQRPGWRAGSALTFMLQQRWSLTLPDGACNMMAFDYAVKYAAKLRIKIANFSTPLTLESQRSCPITITVSAVSSTSTPTKCHATSAERYTVSASSSDVPVRPSQQMDVGDGYVDPNLYRRVLHKEGQTLTHSAARSACASIGSRLCRSGEIFVSTVDELQPFFGEQIPVDPAFPIMIPYENLRNGQRPESSHHNNWMQVSGDDRTKVQYPEWNLKNNPASLAENEKRTNLIPCCGVTGHPAYMAVDSRLDTYWDSGIIQTANLTITVASSDLQSLDSVDITWTHHFAREYRILLARGASSWRQVAQQDFGDGSFDSVALRQHECAVDELENFRVCSPNSFACNCERACNDLVDCSGHGRCKGVSGDCQCDTGWAGAACNNSGNTFSESFHIRIEMRKAALGSMRYGIREIAVRGCNYTITSASTTATLSSDNSSIFTVRTSLTPEVFSVVPARGSTAGGALVTLTGRFFTAVDTAISVSFGPFMCSVKSVMSLSTDEQQVVCLSSASGILRGGLSLMFVTVTVLDVGATVPNDNATFWYIDTWGARTTWGGKAPPTGCGSWAEDKECTDSVYIPSGQVVLLDQNLPRFYLILIEGALIFDRTDIALSANYILVRGGTLQIGTEQEPFIQQVQITLYGHPKSMELPTFGSKVIACYECTMDIHGRPEIAWTELAATVMPGATEIMLQEAVSWPVNSKIVIATTDFESPKSSHSEVATVAAVLDGGKRVQLKDIQVCPEYGFSGLPMNCVKSSALSFPHLGEVKVFDGRPVAFRAEVGLLSRNIVIQGTGSQTDTEKGKNRGRERKRKRVRERK